MKLGFGVFPHGRAQPAGAFPSAVKIVFRTTDEGFLQSYPPKGSTRDKIVLSVRGRIYEEEIIE